MGADTEKVKSKEQGGFLILDFRSWILDFSKIANRKSQIKNQKILSLCALCVVLFSMAGCIAIIQSNNILLAAANSQLTSAQKAGAEQLAKSEFEEARTLLVEAETALKNRDRKARSLIQKAHAKARLAEALTRQSKAETEAAQSEAELEKASAEANRIHTERIAAESELDKINRSIGQ